MILTEQVLRDSILRCTTCGDITEEVIKSTGELRHTPVVKIPRGKMSLYESSIQPVPGSGPFDADYLWIGEAPGEEEDKQIEGFVGRSGKYLKNRLIPDLAKIDVKRCRFVNIVRCHPEDNRNPVVNEIKACWPWLQMEIDLVKPKVIFLIGSIATRQFTGMKVSEAHGQIYDWNGYPCMSLYHPAGVNRAVSRKVLEADYRSIQSKIEVQLDTSGVVRTPDRANVHLATEPEDINELVEAIESVESFALDIETDEPDWVRERWPTERGKKIDPVSNKTIGIAIAYRDAKKEIHSWYIPTGNYSDFELELKQGQDANWYTRSVCIKLQSAIRKSEVIMHNARFEMGSLEKYGLVFKNVYCTMQAAFELGEPFIGLKHLVKVHLNVSMNELSDFVDLKKHPVSHAPLQKVWPYAGADAGYTLRLAELFKERLKDTPMEEHRKRVMVPLIPWTVRVDIDGITIDEDRLNTLLPEITDMMNDEQDDAWDLYEQATGKELGDGEFNLNAPEQKSRILFDELGLPPGGLTPSKKQYKTDKDTIEGLKIPHPSDTVEITAGRQMIGHLLNYSSMSTIRSTHIQGMFKFIHPETYKVHPSFNQSLVRTSRLSADNPNVMNQPARDPTWKVVREAFIPDVVGHLIVAVDQSQIELRTAAHFSEDRRMLEVFKSGRSIHEETCRSVYGLTPEDSEWDYWYKGSKNGNFAVLFLGGVWTLAKTLEISESAAREFYDGHHMAYPEFWSWVDQWLKWCRNRGFSETLQGFRRPLPDLTSKQMGIRKEAERQALSTKIQGTAAGIIQKAMPLILRDIRREYLDARMILQVHDEVVFTCAEEDVEQLVKITTDRLENTTELRVPTPVEAEVGQNWGQLEPYEVWAGRESRR